MLETSAHPTGDIASCAVHSNARPISDEWVQGRRSPHASDVPHLAILQPTLAVAREANCQSARQNPSWAAQSALWAHAGTTPDAAPTWFVRRATSWIVAGSTQAPPPDDPETAPAFPTKRPSQPRSTLVKISSG